MYSVTCWSYSWKFVEAQMFAKLLLKLLFAKTLMRFGISLQNWNKYMQSERTQFQPVYTVDKASLLNWDLNVEWHLFWINNLYLLSSFFGLRSYLPLVKSPFSYSVLTQGSLFGRLVFVDVWCTSFFNYWSSKSFGVRWHCWSSI